MSLENWAEYGWLKRESTSPEEIDALLGVVDRGLADSEVAAISADLRFIAAFSAALTAATAAIRACGYRVSTQAGHHVRTIESLEYTIAAETKLVRKLKTFNSKRNRSSYDVSGVISSQELTAMIHLAADLRSQVRQWLERCHPELLRR